MMPETTERVLRKRISLGITAPSHRSLALDISEIIALISQSNAFAITTPIDDSPLLRQVQSPDDCRRHKLVLPAQRHCMWWTSNPTRLLVATAKRPTNHRMEQLLLNAPHSMSSSADEAELRILTGEFTGEQRCQRTHLCSHRSVVWRQYGWPTLSTS